MALVLTSLAWLCVFHILSVLIFAFGFFHVQISSSYSFEGGDVQKNNIRRFFRDEDCGSKVEEELQSQTPNKAVVILIDAWQHDFFFGRNGVMPFLWKMCDDGRAVAFNTHVQTPTVTLPRIKAITAGSVPSFADVVFNFASTAIKEDNIVDRMKHAGKKITLCGDDTWLKLFPGRFEERSEGTVSFFVNDYTEVDDNVTRCWRNEFLEKNINSWDVIILHYLGLDHIGHSLGGTHHMLDVKLREMDALIEEIHAKLEVLDTSFWIFIFGDHGMTEAGGHGGSSHRETHVPLVFLNSKWAEGTIVSKGGVRGLKVEQVDVVPTVAWILNLPIPTNNLGVTLAADLIDTMSSKRSIHSLISAVMNARQFVLLPSFRSERLQACIESGSAVLQEYCEKGEAIEADARAADALCLQSLRSAQSVLLAKQTDFNVPLVFLSLVVSVTITAISLLHFLNYGFSSERNDQNDKMNKCTRSNFGHAVDAASAENEELCHLMEERIEGKSSPSLSVNFLCGCLVLHAITFFASSLVEEEHDVQYFLFTSSLFILLLERILTQLRALHIQNAAKNIWKDLYEKSGHEMMELVTIIILLCIHRISRSFTEGTRRRWLMEDDTDEQLIIKKGLARELYAFVTSIGSKYSVDLASFLKEQNVFTTSLNALTVPCVAVVLWICMRNFCESQKTTYRLSWKSLHFFGFGALFIKQCSVPYFSESSTWCVVLLCCFVQLAAYQRVDISILLWTAFLFRSYLFPLLILQLLIGFLLSTFDVHPLVVYFAVCASFFYSGNSNSLSTVDIYAAYTGIQSYEPIIVGAQLLLNTYSGPICVLLAFRLGRILKFRFHWKQSAKGFTSKTANTRPTPVIVYQPKR